MVTKTRTVTEQVEVYKPLPEPLVRPLDYPPPLSERFSMDEALDLIFRLYDVVDQANRDRAKAAELTQPSTPAPAPDETR